MKKLKIFWAKMPGYPNFGDALTEFILKGLFNMDVEWAEPKVAEAVGCGSILEAMNVRFTGYVLGSGLMFQHVRMFLENAKIISVRGHLTAKNANVPDAPVGDLGLLASRLAPPPVRKYKLGVVPHYVDKDHPQVKAWAKVPNVLIIDVFQSPLSVIDQINQCDGICSSSLHGLIIADSLRIPSVWIKLSEKVNGAGFKFRDYYSCFGFKDVEPEIAIRFVNDPYNRPNIDIIERELFNNVKAFVEEYGLSNSITDNK